MTTIEDTRPDPEGVAEPDPSERPRVNPLGERIRLTEMRRRGELTDEEYRRRLAEVDSV